jgi:hypothetical protein
MAPCHALIVVSASEMNEQEHGELKVSVSCLAIIIFWFYASQGFRRDIAEQDSIVSPLPSEATQARHQPLGSGQPISVFWKCWKSAIVRHSWGPLGAYHYPPDDCEIHRKPASQIATPLT